ncbi:hypothetical protein [Chryseobacterium sp. StRB126]|uniref:hypothetical protein n=1 Tax=Chryseobacterium sp. StRB126 TaxID=878220 RepID=UPI0005EDB3BB|nr:hypothetical protein [Chryseobacterium sp. StRB126]
MSSIKKALEGFKLGWYLIAVTILCLFKIGFAYYACNGFAFADWLINYQDGGFKRRGLLGTVFVFFYDSFSIKLQYSVFAAQAIVYILFFYLLSLLFKVKQTNIIDVFLFLTPFCLWGFLSDAAIGSRKDGILWLLFSIFTYFLIKNKYSGFREIILLISFSLSVFIHESFIFYAPYFLFILFLHSRKLDIQKSLKIVLAFFIPAVFIFFMGNMNPDYGYTLQLVKECGINLQDSNIFQWKENELIKIQYYREHFNTVSLYVVSFTLELFFILYYIFIIKKQELSNKRLLLITFSILIILTIPLILIAIDVGRWLYNHFILFFIILIFQLPDRKGDVKIMDRSLVNNKNIIFVSLVLIADFVYRVPSYELGLDVGLPLKLLLKFF